MSAEAQKAAGAEMTTEVEAMPKAEATRAVRLPRLPLLLLGEWPPRSPWPSGPYGRAVARPCSSRGSRMRGR